MSRTIVGVLFVFSILAAFPVCAAEPELTPEERQKVIAEVQGQFRKGVEFAQRGKSAEALEQFQLSLAGLQRIYPKSQFPNGHDDLAQGLNNVGFVLQSMGQYEKALPYFEQSLEINRKSNTGGPGRVALSLNNLGYVLLMMGAFEKARTNLDQALTMQEQIYPKADHPNGHRNLAIALANHGGLLREMGLYEQALPFWERALEMHEKLYPPSKYPDGHSDIALSLGNLGNLLAAMGAYEKALPYFEKALAIEQKLAPQSKYPDGHPRLAVALGNLGVLFGQMGQAQKALPYAEQALDMVQKLYPDSKYPDGHVEIALALHNVGTLLRKLKRHEDARTSLERALAMRRKLYPVSKFPNGHPLLMSSLRNLGTVHFDLRLLDDAKSLFDQALEMARKLYPKANFPHGQSDLAMCHSWVGIVCHIRGEYSLAMEHLSTSADMHRRLAEQQIGHASEADALAVQAEMMSSPNEYLTASLRSPGSDATVYRLIWDAKAIVTRALEKRHAIARTAGTAHAAELAHLRDLRRQTERLLQQPRLAPKERDHQLTVLADEREKMERSLAKALPMLARWNDRDKLGPDDLIKSLPQGAIFLDFAFYRRIEFDLGKKGEEGIQVTPTYVAFLLSPGEAPKRIELGNAEPIDKAIRDWRRAIDTGKNGAEAGMVARLVWEPIAKQVPPASQTLYLSPTGDLARIPWAALPGSTQGNVLLDEFTGGIAVVPHGPFLLEHLKFPAEFTGLESILMLGDVAFGNPRWPPLPGTKEELKAIATLAATPPQALTGANASAERLLSALPKARFAHLATHGLFKADELAAEHARKARQVEQWKFQQGQSTTRLTAAKNPLGFVGVVLSGGEVVTGLSLVDLSLENLRLVTLSACETGLGESTGGEGVQGLQRAFHLAGCPNVIASLWKVNDAATAALMAKFYHALWVNKREPLAALREAQLTIYRHPELIPDLAGERGALSLKKAVEFRAESSSGGSKKYADTKSWAAFVLSGVGK